MPDSAMQIVILGSGTGEPSETRGFPGILVTAAGKRILLDSGSGTLRALCVQGVTYLDIDVICYTHFHCDHISELAPILFAMRNMTVPRRKELTLIGPPGFKSYYRGLLSLYAPTLEPEGYRARTEEIGEGVITRPEAAYRVLPVSHTASSIGYRLESGGKSFAYSGDTAFCENLVALGRDADLFALECSFPNEREREGHLTPRLAGAVARRAGCKRLLLTHFYPLCDGFDILGQCRRAYPGEIILASDGMKINL